MQKSRIRLAFWAYGHTFRPFGRILWGLHVHGVENLRRRGPVFLIANHASLLDAFVLLAALDVPIRYVITSNFYRLLTMRWFFWAMGTIPIGGRWGALGAFKRVADVLRTEGIVGLFPEGRISRDGAVHPFQTGVASLALRLGTPVQPACISGSFDALPRWAKWPRFAPIAIHVEPVIPVPRVTRPTEADIAALTAEIQGAVQALAVRAGAGAVAGL